MNGFLFILAAVLIVAAMVLLATNPRDNATAATIVAALAIGLLLLAMP